MTEKALPQPSYRVSQLRVVLLVEDFDQALRCYGNVLGLRQEVVYPGVGEGAEVVLLEAGRATLELVNPAQARGIDALEVGPDAAAPPKIRLAFEVSDAVSATDDLVAAGATLVAPPTQTPWQSLNSRLVGPGAVQLTLFEQHEPE